MPALEAWSRRQKAVLWRFLSYSADGRPTYNEPENVRIRWDDKPRVIRGPQGQPITVDGTAVFGEAIVLQSLLWLATDQTPDSDDATEQWYELGSAGSQTGVVELVSDVGGSDVKSRNRRYAYAFQTHKDKPVT